MKRLFFLLLGFLFAIMQVSAQSREVIFHFDPSTTNALSDTTIQGVEHNISNLLTAINQAYLSNTPISLSEVVIEESARKDLESLWTNLNFYCEESRCVSKCLNDWQGIQAREIAITLVPKDGYNGSLDRELAISLSKGGTITGVRMALENNDYKKFQESANAVSDARIRFEILKFIENLRSYYVEKNIDALKKFYLDESLIVCKNELIPMKGGFDPSVSVKHRKDKTQYLARLERMFRNKKYIHVDFDRISIKRNDSKPDFYGVTLHQDCKTTGYEDHGWLFMLWDFRKKDNPVIHVRTWQPDEQINDSIGVFDMEDFTF